ncbi:MAG: DUF4149 domain-containing protein [Pseudomonadota bacterium]
MIDLIALFALAVLFGGMVFFAAILAPLVFTRLPAEVAGGFIRAVFPVYYLFVLINAAVAAAALVPRLPADAVVMAAVAALTLWLRQGLMPRINRLSDAVKAGDASLKPGFDAAHRLSVILNMVQMLVVAAVLTRWALA